MKKKYQPPKVHKIVLDIEQALIAGCKRTIKPASGNAQQPCSKRCTSVIGT